MPKFNFFSLKNVRAGGLAFGIAEDIMGEGLRSKFGFWINKSVI